MAQQQFEVKLPGGDHILLMLEMSGDKIVRSSWKVTGRLDLYSEIQNIKNQMQGDVSKIAVPSGTSPAQLMLKQLVLKVKGEWPTEPMDPELCHCRKISQESVERAVILGAHTVEKIRQRTSANTGCGTCLPDVEKILELYLG